MQAQMYAETADERGWEGVNRGGGLIFPIAKRIRNLPSSDPDTAGAEHPDQRGKSEPGVWMRET